MPTMTYFAVSLEMFQESTWDGSGSIQYLLPDLPLCSPGNITVEMPDHFAGVDYPLSVGQKDGRPSQACA